eukprot:CAMPEP_0173379282 /NCGR_PEP_ID=MMETSP1356-20130122/2297_1 /TAXON_ID=77927 ORGANISM="Hemiselmis virescens, Strain PCC157" /NCGR_SAMPLE_ID=MMETSP1356 /ASSEMBLY_ACC=CAM_ASM_000847 /LENGTH=351 /DNA_ID=CAMNT_0014332595 /DNA_START=225 /DNA_END=1277 /DNA_ORIENTATION=+
MGKGRQPDNTEGLLSGSPMQEWGTTEEVQVRRKAGRSKGEPGDKRAGNSGGKRPFKQQKMALNASALSQLNGEALAVMLSTEGMRAVGVGEKNKNCHYCEHAPKRCSNVACTECDQIFCANCCKRHLKETELGAPGWKCPICRFECCCTKKVCSKPHLHCKRYRRRIKQEERKAVQSGQAVGARAAIPIPHSQGGMDQLLNHAARAGGMAAMHHHPAHHHPHHMHGGGGPTPVPEYPSRHHAPVDQHSGVNAIDSSSPCAYGMSSEGADCCDGYEEGNVRGAMGQMGTMPGIMMHQGRPHRDGSHSHSSGKRSRKDKDYEVFLSRGMASHGSSFSVEDSWANIMACQEAAG